MPELGDLVMKSEKVVKYIGVYHLPDGAILSVISEYRHKLHRALYGSDSELLKVIEVELELQIC